MISGPRSRSSRARETSTFRKTRKGGCNPGGASSLRSCPRPDSFWKPKNMLCPSAAKSCGGKSNPFGKVSSRADETLTFKAFENSKRGNCHLASTKHLLLIMLEFRFAKLRGVCTFQICIENVTNLVSQLSGSSHLGNLGLSWLGLAWLTWLGLAWPRRFLFQTGSPEDAKPILAPPLTNDFTDLWLEQVNRAQPYYIYIYIYIQLYLMIIYIYIYISIFIYIYIYI